MSPLGTRKYQSRDGGPGFPLSQPSCTPATPRATGPPRRQTGTLTRRHVTWDPRLVTELPVRARLPTVSRRIEIDGWERRGVDLTTPGQRTSRQTCVTWSWWVRRRRGSWGACWCGQGSQGWASSRGIGAWTNTPTDCQNRLWA